MKNLNLWEPLASPFSLPPEVDEYEPIVEGSDEQGDDTVPGWEPIETDEHIQERSGYPKV